MKAKYINPFIAASKNLFQEYLEVNVKDGKPYLNEDPQNLKEVSGIIGLAGDTKGAVVLSFDRETAIRMASRFAKKDYVAVTSDVIDCIGELVNIVAGNAKKGLLEYRIEISLPGVITGNTYRINWPSSVPVITIPYESDFGDFSLNVSMKEKH